MTQPKPIQSLSVNEMLSHIQKTLSKSHQNPPYTLILGSGFSWPLVPTAKGMITGIPKWQGYTTSDQLKELWSELQQKNLDLKLNEDGTCADTSNADNTSLAYTLLMQHELYAPQLRREYIQNVIKDIAGKINPAHIYLASLLDSQFSEDSNLWKYQSKFCSKIFTTNFDPLLQQSLQRVNLLYWMSDQLNAVEVLTDEDRDFIQLIYAHGNTFQHRLANTETDISQRMQEHAKSLSPYFASHGVIVIGYSGWNDCCMEALKQCEQFGLNLYWCDIHFVDEAPKQLRKETVDFLHHHQDSAFYVHIKGADEFTQALHDKLGLGTIPQFLVNPIASMITQFQQMDLAKSDLPIVLPLPTKVPIQTGLPDGKLSDVIKRTMATLNEANKNFSDPNNQSSINIDHLINVAYSDYSKNNYQKALENLSAIINHEQTTPEQKAAARLIRGVTYGKLNPPKTNKEIQDYTAVIDMQDATPEQKADALFNRGNTYGMLNPSQTDNAIKNLTTVIDMQDATPEQKAKAMVNRGVAYAMLNPPKTDKEIQDYTAVIDMQDATPEQKAAARLNRGITYGKLNPPQTEDAIQDYTAVINMQNATPEQKANALFNQGIAYGKLNPPQTDNAIKNFTTVIDMQDATPEQKANALVNRGGTYGMLTPPQTDNAIKNFTAVIDMQDATPEQKAKAMVNRGLTYGMLEKTTQAGCDFGLAWFLVNHNQKISELTQNRTKDNAKDFCNLHLADLEQAQTFLSEMGELNLPYKTAVHVLMSLGRISDQPQRLPVAQKLATAALQIAQDAKDDDMVQQITEFLEDLDKK